MGLGRDEIRQFRRNPYCFNGGEAKKPGQMISKGHKNYELMLNLQLGIRDFWVYPEQSIHSTQPTTPIRIVNFLG
ncbi:hypothetical protein L1887_38945 [Cichorium endivia]|nr:hypothetical protein L1887_38945 [Cichorium endivia]